MRQTLLIFVFLVQMVIAPFSASAQSNYPIFVSPSLLPPYSLQLSDYSAHGSQRLMVTIVVNDLEVANLPVKLRLKMETAGVTIETPVTLNTTPIYLDGGSATVLFGEDLYDYFNLNNLQFRGFSKEAYQRSGQMPEGFYRFSIEVLHFHTNRVISNTGTASAWMALGHPPVLRMPANEAELGQYMGVPITFSWLSSNVGSPVSAGSIRYKFELWEVRVKGVNPYNIVRSMPVFHEHVTSASSYSFNPASVMMEEGMTYAWRVTAFDESGLVPFAQNGESEVRTFTYKSRCEAVHDITATAGGQKGTFVWTPEKNHTSFNVEVRNADTDWFSASETYDSKVEFFQLERGQTYELRVQAVCNGDAASVSDYSSWTSLLIPDKKPDESSDDCPDCACSDDLPDVELTNFELRHDLTVGDTLTNKTGTTRFIVREVNPQGNGIYSGVFYFWGELWGMKVPCEFHDLQVNTDNVIVNMDYKSINDPKFLVDVDALVGAGSDFLDQWATVTAKTNIVDTISVQQEFDYVVVKDGGLYAVVVEQDTVVERPMGVSLEEAKQKLITNADGDEVVISSKGEPMGVQEFKATGGNNRLVKSYNEQKEKEQLTDGSMVGFSPYDKQNYGFDAYDPLKQKIQHRYPNMANGYRPAFKSVESFRYDKVLTDASSGISFRDEMGIPALSANGSLNIQGHIAGSNRALYAYRALSDSTEEVVGKLNVVSFDNAPKRVHIVPVNGAKMPTQSQLEHTLKQVYKQAIATWTVVSEPGVSLDFPGGRMTHEGSGTFSTYNHDQTAIVDAYVATGRKIERGDLYLFFVDGATFKDRSLAGYMPLNRQVGFIYDNPSPIIVAHELGHGAFNLRHTFSPEEFIQAESNTQNLMDYAGGTELWQHQWDLIHNPEKILFSWAQDEEEGAMRAINNSEKVKAILEFIRNSYIESSTGILNLYEHGRYFEIYGDVSLIEGCSSKIHITMGMDAWESGEILIDKEEMLEMDDPLKSGYDYAISYFNKGRHDNKFAINIYCEKVDKYLLKDYLTGIPESRLQCVDVPNCDDVDTDLPYNANEAIANILNSIRNANVSGQTSTNIQWPESAGNSMIGCEINLYEDLSFRIAVTKELYAQNIKTKMSSVTYNSHNRPASRWEIAKAFLNELGASFKLGEFSGEEKLRVFQFSDVNKPDHELSVVVEDRYANILGHYLFGESWETDFTATDRQWVLYIYSPEISSKFEAVKTQTEGNLLEQRRLTYYALTSQFPDNSISRLTGSSNSFLSKHNYAAQLKHNPSAATKGVTVYTYTVGSNGIKISETPMQYNYNPEFNENDIYYPVDVKLWDGDNNQPALGNDYYGAYDFKGKYREGTFAVGPPTGGSGVLAGYLRGFGYNEFYYAGVGATGTYTLEVSGEAGLVDGKYKGFGKPTPLNFAGPGTNITVSAGEFNSPIGFALSSWQGYNDRGVQSWNGITVGLDITIGLSNVLLPASVNYMRVQTDLHFPSPNKTKKETLDILNNNSYYVGE